MVLTLSYFITLLSQATLSFIGTLGFAVLYNVPRQALLLCAAIGAAGNTLRLLVADLGLTENVATFFGALLVGLVGAIPAKRMNLPLVLFAITGIICMIPSIAAYKVVVYFSRGEILGGLQSAIEAGFGVGAIAAGIGTARILTDAEWGFEKD